MELIYIISFCIFFLVSYLILQASRLPECFKTGKLWQIKSAYILISFIISYLITEGLYKIAQIIQNNII